MPQPQLRFKILLPFAHAIQIGVLQVPRTKTERIVIKIIRKPASQTIIALQDRRKGVVTSKKMRQPAGETRIAKQFVSVIPGLGTIEIRIRKFVEFGADIIYGGGSVDHLDVTHLVMHACL